jgi:membrane protein YdbS with pleckstrin-like domain
MEVVVNVRPLGGSPEFSQMTRTFFVLAVFVILAMLVSIGVGFYSFSLDRSTFQNQVFIVHFYLGLATAIGILLVHCLIFTYFLGTGRWVKEVGLAFELPDARWSRLTRELKRATFPPALFAMLIGIATAAAGAGAQLQAWPWYVHAALAFLTLFVNLWAFHIEYRSLALNGHVIQAVLEEVDRIRAARGLQSNAQALLQEEV